MADTHTTLTQAGLLLCLISLLPAPLQAAGGGPSGGGKTEVLPMTKAAPAVVIIETAGSEMELRRQLRQKNRVNELTGASKIPFSQAPTGSFGFIAPQFLGIALVTQSPDLVLDRVAPGPNAYEVHKLADGSGMLVGFVRQDLISPLSPAERPKNIRVAIFSNIHGHASHIAAIPMTKLMVDRMPVRVDPNKPDSAVVLDMDLQSTANRRSVPGSQ
jgi:hypothetical protein